jgi:hypothetical protein
VAKGEGKVNVGERRLEAGELEVRRGREQLRLAKGARVACALGAAVFAALSIVLGFRWRRALAGLGGGGTSRNCCSSPWATNGSTPPHEESKAESDTDKCGRDQVHAVLREGNAIRKDGEGSREQRKRQKHRGASVRQT